MPMSLRAQVNAGIDPVLSADDVRVALEERFLLPALYGGEVGHEQSSASFEAMVVLEAPSVQFTRKEWKTWAEPCASPAEAINRHRKIFFKWAFAEQSHDDLFRGLLGGKPSTEEEFFRRLYITDIWKDAAFINERHYVQYWQSQLEKEISGITTEDVVFVGKPAYKYGKKCLPRNKRCYRFPFPKPYTKNFESDLRRGLDEFHGRPKGQPASAQSSDAADFTFSGEEAAHHEAGHFVIGFLFAVPLGDINMVPTFERRASVSAIHACDWVREVSGEAQETRLKQLVRVLVAGEEAMIVYGAARGKARWSAAGDVQQIFKLLESAQDSDTRKMLSAYDIHQWMEDARTVVNGKFSDLRTWSAVRDLASHLSGTAYMPAAEANRIVAAAFGDLR